MKRIAILISILMCAATLAAQDITGTWSGKADFGLQSLNLVFHIEKTDGGYSATMDSPDQNASGIEASSASFEGDTLRIAVSRIGFSYTGVLDGDKITGALTQRGATFPLDLKRGSFAYNRPQEPLPPYPYISEEVVFENKKAGIKLAGTLSVPESGGKFPAVVLITGSGPQNRDEEIMGHKPFLVLADYLTRRGIAVLRFDDRGFGESEGDFASATTADFATDASAAVDYLRTRKEIDKKKIGVAGHSEGAAAAFMTAANRRDIAFVISMAGAGMDGGELLMWQNNDILKAEENTPENFTDYYVATLGRAYEIVRTHEPEFLAANADSLAGVVMRPSLYYKQTRENISRIFVQASQAWFNFFIKYDPTTDIRRVKCPVMAINGNKDLQVSSDNLSLIAFALQESDNWRLNIREYPGLNHLFQTSETGKIQEYGKIEETISPRVLEDIAEWIPKALR